MTRYLTGHTLMVVAYRSSALGACTAKRKPVTPGFWPFANRKSKTTHHVVAACRNYIEIRFVDGHYIGLRIYKLESGVTVREVGEVSVAAHSIETRRLNTVKKGS